METKAYTIQEKKDMIKKEARRIYDRYEDTKGFDYAEELVCLYRDFIMYELPTKKEGV